MRALPAMLKKTIWVVALALVLNGCSAFLIRHTDTRGKTRTYVTDTVFVGTGTFLDCIISPFHWAGGLFYFQPYVHVKGSAVSYPTFGGSGCFGRGYGQGAGVLGVIPVKIPFLTGQAGGTTVYFVDINHKEVVLTGGSLEITRVTRRINFSRK